MSGHPTIFINDYKLLQKIVWQRSKFDPTRGHDPTGSFCCVPQFQIEFRVQLYLCFFFFWIHVAWHLEFALATNLELGPRFANIWQKSIADGFNFLNFKSEIVCPVNGLPINDSIQMGEGAKKTNRTAELSSWVPKNMTWNGLEIAFGNWPRNGFKLENSSLLDNRQ